MPTKRRREDNGTDMSHLRQRMHPQVKAILITAATALFGLLGYLADAAWQDKAQKSDVELVQKDVDHLKETVGKVDQKTDEIIRLLYIPPDKRRKE